MRLDDWIEAVIITSNLLGRLEIGDQRNELDDEFKQLWSDMRGDLRISEDFRTWYSVLGCGAIVDGVLTPDRRHGTPAAENLVRLALETMRDEADQLSLDDYRNLLTPDVERLLHEPETGLQLATSARDKRSV